MIEGGRGAWRSIRSRRPGVAHERCGSGCINRTRGAKRNQTPKRQRNAHPLMTKVFDYSKLPFEYGVCASVLRANRTKDLLILEANPFFLLTGCICETALTNKIQRTALQAQAAPSQVCNGHKPLFVHFLVQGCKGRGRSCCR